MNKQLCVMIFLLYEVSETIYGNIMQLDPVLTVHEGDAAVLSCFITKQQMSMTLWYKQVAGEEPHLVASSIVHSATIQFHNKFDSGRFKVSRESNTLNLNIVNTVQSDSATYYCAFSFSNVITFGNGTRLVVKGAESHKFTNLLEVKINASLQCSVQNQLVRGEHRLYWFTHGSEFPPGFIYIHGNSSEPCVGSSESDCVSPTCFYNLPKKTLSSSETEIYYCAMTTCGQALFGNVSQTNPDAVGSQNIFFIQIGLAGLLTISFAINILLCCLRRNGRKSQQIQTANEEDDDVSINQNREVTYATVKTYSKYSKDKRESKQEDTLYSGLACQQHS